MKYYKLKISLDNYEEKLNRTILFKHNSDLDQLAFTILSIFNTFAYHLYMFEDAKDKYECDISIKEGYNFGEQIEKESMFVTIDQLELINNKFKMIYDYGCNYEFIIEVLDLIELKEIFTVPRVIDGKGYGICEDNKYEFENFLNGEAYEDTILFCKGSKLVEMDFNSFDVNECNIKLKKEISKIRNGYYCYI